MTFLDIPINLEGTDKHPVLELLCPLSIMGEENKTRYLLVLWASAKGIQQLVIISSWREKWSHCRRIKRKSGDSLGWRNTINSQQGSDGKQVRVSQIGMNTLKLATDENAAVSADWISEQFLLTFLSFYNCHAIMSGNCAEIFVLITFIAFSKDHLIYCEHAR